MMHQPGAGAAVPPPQQQQPHMGHPPSMAPAQHYQQAPGAGAPSPYMMMMPPMAQSQPPPPTMWHPHQAQQQGQPGQPSSADEVRTLWIGDLQYWMDENYLNHCFASTGEVVSVKVIRNKQSGAIEGYGFIEFASRGTAERVLQTYNGQLMPNGEQNYRLNWASFSGGEKRDDSPDFTIFVGDLAADVTDYLLQETFKARYPSIKGAKVVIDRATGRTKGYGFVRFGDENEQLRAMTEMNGVYCGSRQMRLGLATNKKGVAPKASYPNSQTQNENDPTNTTIFVGNVDSNVMEDNLRELFGTFGQLLSVKIPAGKRCAFVQFADRNCAEEALQQLHGAALAGQNIRLSWGRSPSNRQPQQDANQWNGGGYYGGYTQGYENYGYAAAPQDPNMYYGNYPGYGNYQQSQQPPQQQPQQVGYS